MIRLGLTPGLPNPAPVCAPSAQSSHPAGVGVSPKLALAPPTLLSPYPSPGDGAPLLQSSAVPTQRCPGLPPLGLGDTAPPAASHFLDRTNDLPANPPFICKPTNSKPKCPSTDK